MIGFITDIYEEHGFWPFLLFGFLLCFFAFLITVACLEGTEHCFHSFEFGSYCSDCGAALVEFCPGCGKVFDDAAFCSSCGIALK